MHKPSTTSKPQSPSKRKKKKKKPVWNKLLDNPGLRGLGGPGKRERERAAERK